MTWIIKSSKVHNFNFSERRYVGNEPIDARPYVNVAFGICLLNVRSNKKVLMEIMSSRSPSLCCKVAQDRMYPPSAPSHFLEVPVVAYVLWVLGK